MIRITGGINRSRLLATPKSTETKPTMDKVRAAVFSALGDSVKDAEILDLFAGSGSYGFEALSRGAKNATFVDKSREAYDVITQNASSLKEQNVTVVFSDAIAFLEENTRKFNIIFIDPPYKLDVYYKVMDMITYGNFLSDNGIVVLESEYDIFIDQNKFSNVREYHYGLAKIYIIRK